jgi:transposase-like protein
MGKRKNVTIETAEQPKGTRLTAAQKQQIVRLYDLPATVSQIAQEVGVPRSQVRRTLAEMVPADAKLWRSI